MTNIVACCIKKKTGVWKVKFIDHVDIRRGLNEMKNAFRVVFIIVFHFIDVSATHLAE